MIIARLIGGLGNQLFQYAAARKLADIHKTDLLIDISEYEQYKLHNFSLQHLNIIQNVASKEHLQGIEVLKEKHFHYDPDFVRLPNNIILKGYWQTEKYFIDISDIIRNEFTVKYPLKERDLEVATQINSSNSVSVHIRRCDYVPDTYSDQIFNSLSLNYYVEAVKQLSQKVNDLTLFIFSDDPQWVKDNVHFEHPQVFVEHNTAATNYEDMRLMRLCKHNIIANSSFSWWGAWLNDNPHKVVYAPSQWFNSNARNLNAKDIIPEEWIKI